MLKVEIINGEQGYMVGRLIFIKHFIHFLNILI